MTDPIDEVATDAQWAANVVNGVYERLSEGAEPESLVEHLVALGITPETAREIVTSCRRHLAKGKTLQYVVTGAFLLMVGVGATAISYLIASPNDGFRVAVGALVVGGAYLIYGAARFGLGAVLGIFTRDR